MIQKYYCDTFFSWRYITNDIVETLLINKIVNDSVSNWRYLLSASYDTIKQT